MKIYTRKGDKGFTRRPGGRKLHKNDAFFQALGSIDELNACVGWCLAEAQAAKAHEVCDVLVPIQAELLTLGAMLAAVGSAPLPVAIPDAAVTRMEKQIDHAMGQLPPLTHFILPGGGELSCRLHLARTLCRRAERAAVQALDEVPGPGDAAPAPTLPAPALKYINRLSDLLFALARLAAHVTGHSETLWVPKGNGG